MAERLDQWMTMADDIEGGSRACRRKRNLHYAAPNWMRYSGELLHGVANSPTIISGHGGALETSCDGDAVSLNFNRGSSSR
jgi:hypothetical protein